MTALVFLVLLLTSCISTKVDSIPLTEGEIPYILASGDYTDVNGNVHSNQCGVWAMPEADVYNYLLYTKKISSENTGLSKIKDYASALVYPAAILWLVTVLVLVRGRK